ncbi:hypothetical protein B0H10DRAFT_368594 [Mycena sp. CBHHK59/15]|nr:hypothetical protein B0H10DRAFT_368594 [Mycena sp. CBHHK59/15]
MESNSESDIYACLPQYSPSHPSPCYSLYPACDETRLDLTPHAGTRPLPTDVFTKAYGSATVVLLDQEPNAQVPTYGRQGSVRGTLILKEDTLNVSEIVVKLEGRLDITTTDAGAMSIKAFKDTHTLWPPNSESSSMCPTTIDFSCLFPAAFRHTGQEYPLPPSYIARFAGFPALFAKITYSLIILIKVRRLGFMSKTKCIYVVLDYNPRMSPPRGISLTQSFLAEVKAMPEEWHQFLFNMKTRSSSTLAPIQGQMFIPSVRVFGLSDTIPLHVQLSGPVSSLRELIPPPTQNHDAATTVNYFNSLHLKPAVRVYMNRMVSFEYRGKLVWRVSRIGEGRALPLPPVMDYDCDFRDTNACGRCDSHVEDLDWRAEVKCNPDVTVGGFSVIGLVVKDFIVLELAPPNPISSPLMTVQHAVPIRLVTESFVPPS